MMSLKDLRNKSASALEAPVMAKPVASSLRRPVTAPGATAMMQPTIDALNERAKIAEGRVAELEAKVKAMDSIVVKLNFISPNPWQPRRFFDEDEIQQLANSISELGLIEPVVVRRVQNLDTFELVAGERRLRAHRLLGKDEIRAVVLAVDDSEMALMALAENIDRADLSDYEISVAIRRAEKDFPSRKGMAKSLGMERSDLYRYLAFQELPDFAIEDLDQNPNLLGRVSAERLVSVMRKIGDGSSELLRPLWQQLKNEEIDQTKLANVLASGKAPKLVKRATERDIRKLFVGKEQAGSITRDDSSLIVKIRATALSQLQADRLREFVENLLKE